VSTTKQDLTRQIDALTAVGIPVEQIYLDKKSGTSTDRPGLQALLGYARAGDVIVVHTLDRLGRTVRDTLNLIHELRQRGVGVRNLADPIRIDSADPEDPMAQLAVVLLALFGQMERTYTLERAAHARAVATAKGRRIGRPSVIDEHNSPTQRTCAMLVTPSPRLSLRPGSPAPVSTGTSRCDHPSPSPPPAPILAEVTGDLSTSQGGASSQQRSPFITQGCH
jgi:DNA invertase Pin-like site-specific DNA recombinase